MRYNTGENCKHKVYLIKSLTNRAVRICSKATLPDELVNPKNIFRQNGYLIEIVARVISNVTTQNTERVTRSSSNGELAMDWRCEQEIQEGNRRNYC